MAFASDRVDSALNNMEEDLSCCICYNLLREPKDLDCQHVYCLQCLENWVGQQPTIECPECRHITLVPKDGLDSLKTNLRLKNMVKKYEAQAEKQTSVPICLTHEGERQHFFCVTCNVTVCHNCLVRKHPESQHEIEELKDITKKWKEEMVKKLDRINEAVQKAVEDERKLDEMEAQVLSAQALAESKVNERADVIIAEVEAKREEMMRQIQETGEKNLQNIQEEKNHTKDNVQRLQNVHSASQKVVDTASDHVYMKQHPVLVDKMEKLCDAKHEIPVSDMACLHFNPGSDSVNSTFFGRVVENNHEMYTLTHTTEFGSFQGAVSLATTQSGLLAVVECESNEVIVYRDDNGEFKRQFCLGDSSDDPNGKVTNPVSVAVTSEDKFLVIDDGPVKVFLASGQYEQTLPIDGNLITTTPDNMIVVGSNIREDIKVYRSNSELLKTHVIESKNIADIASNDKQIAYT